MKPFLRILVALGVVALVVQWTKPLAPQQATYTIGGVDTAMSRAEFLEFVGEDGELKGKDWGFVSYCRICGRRNFEDKHCIVHEGRWAMAVVLHQGVDEIFSSEVEQNGEVFLKAGDSLAKVRELLGPERKEDLEGEWPMIQLRTRGGRLYVELKDDRVTYVRLIGEDAFQ